MAPLLLLLLVGGGVVAAKSANDKKSQTAATPTTQPGILQVSATAIAAATHKNPPALFDLPGYPGFQRNGPADDSLLYFNGQPYNGPSPFPNTGGAVYTDGLISGFSGPVSTPSGSVASKDSLLAQFGAKP